MKCSYTPISLQYIGILEAYLTIRGSIVISDTDDATMSVECLDDRRGKSLDDNL